MGKVKKAIRALKKEEKTAKEEMRAEDSIKKAMLKSQPEHEHPGTAHLDSLLRSFSTYWLPNPKP